MKKIIAALIVVLILVALGYGIYYNGVRTGEKAAIFNLTKVEDYNSFAMDQKSVIEQNAKEKGLLKTAQENAKKAIEELLLFDNYIKENYSNEFK
ncbi:MAG: DUF4230 domain-containing protein [Ezakiella sp.]|nr:DUF4230 domain-containing protein [Bacillota bacterium]MDY3946678.1 DUF4230 domain-containing protein [Ezakiella sp.]